MKLSERTPLQQQMLEVTGPREHNFTKFVTLLFDRLINNVLLEFNPCLN